MLSNKKTEKFFLKDMRTCFFFERHENRRTCFWGKTE